MWTAAIHGGRLLSTDRAVLTASAQPKLMPVVISASLRPYSLSRRARALLSCCVGVHWNPTRVALLHRGASRSPAAFCVLLFRIGLQDGESAQFVQEQLGHASITLTTSTYGKWLPKRPVRGGVNSLDEACGSKTVASGDAVGRAVSQVGGKIGSPGWARTSDILINSQALYRLSYRGVFERTPSL